MPAQPRTFRALLLVTLLLFLSASFALAQGPTVSGDYTGQLGPLHLVVHVVRDSAGKLSGSLDSPDQGAHGIPCEAFTLDGVNFSFKSAAVGGSYHGTVSADGKTITGTWNQGRDMPLVLTVSAAPVAFVPAEKPGPIDGDWTGAITTPAGSLPAVIHIKSDQAGKLYVSFDSPTQGAIGLPCTNATLTGATFSFDLPLVKGRYQGTLASDGNTITGEWNQGTPLPLTLTRKAPFVAADKPSAADGDWSGTLTTPAGQLPIALHVKSDNKGQEYAALDSPAQLTRNLEGHDVTLTGSSFSFTVPDAHHARFSGTLSAAGLDGTWAQDKLAAPVPVHLTHAKLQAPSAPAAAGPLSLDALASRLDSELKPMLQNPAVAGDEGIGVSIGLYAHGQRRNLTYGVAHPESLFEIGSITKTFTSLLLAEAVTQGQLTLETPVRELLPAGLVAKPDGPEVTLLSLATHHSGLPRMPDNFHPADPENPYADYTQKDLFAAIAKLGLARDPKAPFAYSNLGVGLLGQALALRAGKPYPQLLQSGVLAPLGLTHTFIQIPSSEAVNFLTAHGPHNEPGHAWDLDAMAPAGGIRSTADDMLTYLVAQIHPPTGLQAAITLQHQPQADADGARIALNWFLETEPNYYWHNGATGGFTSWGFFQPSSDIAAIVLVNRSSGLADSLGMQIAALLEGRTPNPLHR